MSTAWPERFGPKTLLTRDDQGDATNPLTRKMNAFARLSDDDRRRLNDFCKKTVRLKAGTEIVSVGAKPAAAYVLLEGWAYRYTVLTDGRRQIISFYVPGDVCDVYAFIRREMDYSISLLTESTLSKSPVADLWQLLWSSSQLGQALFRSTLSDEGIIRGRLVSLGRRDSYERIAHLFCEAWARLDRVGLTGDHTASFPFTQEQISDLSGMTPVHVNRVLGALRRDGVAVLKGKVLSIPDLPRLFEIADFDPSNVDVTEAAAPLPWGSETLTSPLSP